MGETANKTEVPVNRKIELIPEKEGSGWHWAILEYKEYVGWHNVGSGLEITFRKAAQTAQSHYNERVRQSMVQANA